MKKDIKYKKIKYQDMNDEVKFKEKVQQYLQGSKEIQELQEEITSLERKKEVTLGVNLPITLIIVSTLIGIVSSYISNKTSIIFTIIIVLMYVFIAAIVFLNRTNKLLEERNKKIDLCENIKKILQESNIMEEDKNNAVDVEREMVLKNVKIENTCIKEYLEIMKEEYQIERSKRQSFESRAGIIITILTALCVFVFNKIRIKDIIMLMGKNQCSFLELIQIVTGITSYAGFIIALFYVLKTINVRNYKNFNVVAVNEGLMGKPVIEGCIKLVKTYKEIIIDHREENEKKAQYLKRAYTSIFVTIVSIIVYVNIYF